MNAAACAQRRLTVDIEVSVTGAGAAVQGELTRLGLPKLQFDVRQRDTSATNAERAVRDAELTFEFGCVQAAADRDIAGDAAGRIGDIGHQQRKKTHVVQFEAHFSRQLRAGIDNVGHLHVAGQVVRRVLQPELERTVQAVVDHGSRCSSACELQ